MALETITLSDGRRLDVSVVGRDGGLPLVWHHGTPGSGDPSRLLEREAVRRGLRLVTYSRPGYGDSDRLENRSVAQAADDVTAILDRIGAEEFVTAGWSGGGPHALAAGAIVPGVRAVLTVAGLGPYTSAETLDFFGGMGVDNIQEFGAARNGARGLREYLDGQRPVMMQDSPDDVVTSIASVMSEVDRGAMRDEFGEDVSASFRAALRHGVDGWLDDDVAFVSDWGFDPRSVPAPVHVWQGGQDRMVPFDHGKWLADEIPTAVPHLLPDEGHVSIITGRLGEMLDELVAAAK